MLHFLLFILFIPWLTMFHVDAGVILLNSTAEDANNLFSASSYSFFQGGRGPSAVFTSSGPIQRLILVKDDQTGECQVRYKDDEKPRNISNVVFLVQWKRAPSCGLYTFSQLWEKIPGYAEKTLRTVVILLNVGDRRPYRGDDANPTLEPFLSRVAGVTDEPPPPDLRVAFLGWKSSRQLLRELQRRSRERLTLVVKGEPGAWNNVLDGMVYYIVTYTLLGLISLGVVGFSFRAVQRMKKRRLGRGLLEVAFVFALIGSIIFGVSLLFRVLSRVGRILDVLSAFFIGLSYHVLLTNWALRLCGPLTWPLKNTPKMALFLLVLLVLSALHIIASTTTNLILVSVPNTRAIEMMGMWMGLSLSVLQGLIAIVFLFLLMYFLHSKSIIQRHRPEEAKSLVFVAVLASVGFLGYVILVSINFPRALQSLQSSPSGLLAHVLSKRVGIVMRALAMLAVLETKVENIQEEHFAPKHVVKYISKQ